MSYQGPNYANSLHCKIVLISYVTRYIINDVSMSLVGLFSSVLNGHAQYAVMMLVSLKRVIQKSSVRCLSYYPIDEHVFGLSDEQQLVSAY